MPASSNDYVRVTPVVIDYADLVNPHSTIDTALQEAFGPSGLGVCLVRNIPGYEQRRERILTLSSALASLDKQTLDAITHKPSVYHFGWSHGKEIMNGKEDLSKGSFYNNPVYNADSEPDEYRQNFPMYAYPNVYPPESKLPGLQDAFEDLGKLIVDTANLLAVKCDQYLEQNFPDLPRNLLSGAISTTKTTKSRLLHYFPVKAADTESGQMDSWCGRHIDHSLITGLTSAMYQDDAVQQKILASKVGEPTNDDKIEAIRKSRISMTDYNGNDEYREALKDSGLYICPRTMIDKGDDDLSSKYLKVSIPVDMLAFQIGEAAQIASRGLFVATPHLVKGAAPLPPGVDFEISRNTYACFVQPNVDVELKPGYTFQDFSNDVLKRHY